MTPSVRRGLVAGSLLVALSWGLVPQAGAHHTRDFHACIKVGQQAPCRKHDGAPGGVLVIVRGLVQPSHHGYRAEVWRRLPESGGDWKKIAETPIHQHGKMRWEWNANMSDENCHATYGFQFRIPGHGRSNKTRIWVCSDV